MADFKAVIFDYYETLAQLPSDGRERLFDRIAADVGYESPSGVPYREWTGQTSELKLRFPGASSKRPAVNGEPLPFRTFWDYWKERFDLLFKGWGVDAGGEVGADAYTEHHVHAELYPEVQDTLQELRRSVTVAILSNADDAFLWGSAKKNKLELDAIVSSEELRAYKPHVSIYRQMCERLGIEPADALYVGDQAWADVQGSRNAGMGQAWVNRHGEEWPDDVAPPQHTVTSLADLLEIVG